MSGHTRGKESTLSYTCGRAHSTLNGTWARSTLNLAGIVVQFATASRQPLNILLEGCNILSVYSGGVAFYLVKKHKAAATPNKKVQLSEGN